MTAGYRLQIGRDSTNDIVVGGDQVQVGRFHAEVEVRLDGGLYIHDLGTRNGTSVNGRRIHGPTPLQLTDQIHLGSYLFDTSRLAHYVQRSMSAQADVPAGPPPPESSSGPGAVVIRIGRESDNHIVLPPDSTEVSRYHAEVTIEADGALTIRDLGTRNGVGVSGTRIGGPTRFTLSDVVTLGTYRLDTNRLRAFMSTAVPAVEPALNHSGQVAPPPPAQQKEFEPRRRSTYSPGAVISISVTLVALIVGVIMFVRAPGDSPAKSDSVSGESDQQDGAKSEPSKSGDKDKGGSTGPDGAKDQPDGAKDQPGSAKDTPPPRDLLYGFNPEVEKLLRRCYGSVPKIPSTVTPAGETLREKFMRTQRRLITQVSRPPKQLLANVGGRLIAQKCRRGGARGAGTIDGIVRKLTGRVPPPVIALTRFPVNIRADAGRSVNAFMSAGGRGCVYQGLVDNSPSIAGLAFVIGHEIGHHALGHIELRIRAQLAWQRHLRKEALTLAREKLRQARSSGVIPKAIVRLLEKKVDELERNYQGLLNNLAASLGTAVSGVMSLSYSKDHEYEADVFGLCLARAAGYSSDGAARFFQLLMRHRGPAGRGNNPWADLVSSHPHPRDRYRFVRKLSKRLRAP